MPLESSHPRGRPRTIPIVERMVDALTVYSVDLNHTPAVHLALFRAGFSYPQVRDQIGEAIAVAQARSCRR